MSAHLELANDHIQIAGADVFIVRTALPVVPQVPGRFEQILISNRGTKIWPGPLPNIELVNVHRCRFVPKDRSTVTHSEILDLLKGLEAAGFEWVHVEKLLIINGAKAYTLAQGE